MVEVIVKDVLPGAGCKGSCAVQCSLFHLGREKVESEESRVKSKEAGPPSSQESGDVWTTQMLDMGQD